MVKFIVFKDSPDEVLFITGSLAAARLFLKRERQLQQQAGARFYQERHFSCDSPIAFESKLFSGDIDGFSYEGRQGQGCYSLKATLE